MKLEKNKVVVDGLETTYYEAGQGEPLLFLHGGRVQALTFKKNIQLMAEQYRVIAPDIPGYGESETPREVWSFVEYGRFFDSFLQQLQLQDVAVVGYSMGGGVAFNLAASSECVSRLVLVDAAGIPTESDGGSRDMERLGFYLTHPRYLSSLAVLFRDYFRFTLKHRHDQAHITNIRAKCLTTDYKTFKQVHVPTLIVWGRDDGIYPLSVAREFHQRIPDSTLKIAEGNHDWPLYDPLLLRQAML